MRQETPDYALPRTPPWVPTPASDAFPLTVQVTFGVRKTWPLISAHFMKNHFDTGSVVVLFVTLVLFAVALVAKGFTHDLLLEAGVFLVSVKLVMTSYKNTVASILLQERTDEILEIVRRIEGRK